MCVCHTHQSCLRISNAVARFLGSRTNMRRTQSLAGSAVTHTHTHTHTHEACIHSVLAPHKGALGGWLSSDARVRVCLLLGLDKIAGLVGGHARARACAYVFVLAYLLVANIKTHGARVCVGVCALS